MSHPEAPSSNSPRSPSDLSPPSADLLKTLGPPPLYQGEDVDAYDRLYRRLRAAVSPIDTIEELWVRDVADLAWETLRLRRLRTKFTESRVVDGLWEALRGWVPDHAERRALVKDWAKGSSDARREIDRLTEEADIDRGVIEAKALTDRIDLFERIDRMIMQAEARRNATLRELDRHRDAVTRRMREALAIEDAEFEDLPRAEAAE